MAVGISGLEIAWPLLLLQVSSHRIAEVMTSHDVAMHVLLAMKLTVEASNAVGLSHKSIAGWAFFGSVILIHSHDDIAQGPRL